MIAQGADIIDVGAESTRPGSLSVPADQQQERLAEILPGISKLGVPVSIDTSSATLARWALDVGASIINDISAGRADPALLPLAAKARAPIVLMHMQGEPRTMQAAPTYVDVVEEVYEFLAERLEAAEQTGHRPPALHRRSGHRLRQDHGAQPVAPGGGGRVYQTGRTRADWGLAQALHRHDHRRGRALRALGGSLAAACAAYMEGATIFRVHDVAATRQALDVLDVLGKAGRQKKP